MHESDSIIGLIMAGGLGERMRRSGQKVPKPMVPVLGAPLIERNLLALLRAGIRETAVVVAADGPVAAGVTAWARRRGSVLAEAGGGRLRLIVEPQPMGNAGAMTLLRPGGAHVLLVFADNLTALDLRSLADEHLAGQADLTLAVHEETFRIPYGVAEVAGGRIKNYHEKPDLTFLIGSGVAIAGPGAVAAFESRRPPAGVTDLVRVAVDAHLVVLPKPHRAAWIDVNDVEAQARATEMVLADPEAFERCWPTATPETVVPGSGLVLVRIDDIDAAGRPCRLLVPTSVNLGSLPRGLPAAARVRAWVQAHAGGAALGPH